MNAPRSEDDPVNLIRQRTRGAAAARAAEAAVEAEQEQVLEPDGGLDALDGSTEPAAGGPIGTLLAKIQSAFTKLLPEPEDDGSRRSALLGRLRSLPLPVLAGVPVGALLLFMVTCSMIGGPSAPGQVAVHKLPVLRAGFAGPNGLAVHYASFSGDRSQKQLRLAFQPADRPYVLFLSVQHDGGLKVTLDTPPAEHLKAVVVNTTGPGVQIEGLPPDAKAYVLREPKFFAAPGSRRANRREDRRVGKDGRRLCRSRRSP